MQSDNPIFSIESKRGQHRRHNALYQAKSMPCLRCSCAIGSTVSQACGVGGVICCNVGPYFLDAL